MSRLEDRLLELGYEKSLFGEYFKDVSSYRIMIYHIENNEFDYAINTYGRYWLKLKDIDNLQQAFNILQNDLEKLKQC